MIVARSISELALPWGQPIGFVPTMGAFHEGHLALMRKAKNSCGFCVVSLFVNPTQFREGEDFDRYPRDEGRDFDLAQESGVDLIFAPTVDDMYSGVYTSIDVGPVAARWEGEYRPGHFEGVATVVAKLFNIVRPTAAYFGEKDYQQCQVIRQLVHDLNFPLELHIEETVREPDGLAMSSRNMYLSVDERERAPLLHKAIRQAATDLESGSKVTESTQRAKQLLEANGFDVQYLAAVDGSTLEPLERPVDGGRILVAAFLGRTRLIDNCAIG